MECCGGLRLNLSVLLLALVLLQHWVAGLQLVGLEVRKKVAPREDASDLVVVEGWSASECPAPRVRQLEGVAVAGPQADLDGALLERCTLNCRPGWWHEVEVDLFLELDLPTLGALLVLADQVPYVPDPPHLTSLAFSPGQ